MTPTPTTTNRIVRVNQDRLWSTLMELAAIGAYTDQASGLTGVTRQTLTDDESAGRHLVVAWMKDAGLSVRIDRMGNVFGRRPGTDSDAAPVMAGSHIDAVATAGAFDGCLGVLGGIEAIRTLNESGIHTRRPIEICFFTEEEGCASAPTCWAQPWSRAGSPSTTPTR